jgi:hypothetical protein
MTRSRAARGVLVAALVGILLLGSFGVAMRSEDHNEQMYVTAAVLLLHGQRLYVDFAFFQMPYLPHVYRAAFAVTPTTRYLLTARVITWLFWIAAGVAIYAIGRALAGDRSIALGAAALFATNLFALRIVEESSNYVLPLTLSLAAFGCLLLARRPERSRPGAAGLALLSGLLLAGSVGVKLSHAAPALPLLVAAWVPPRPARGRAGRWTVPAATVTGFGLGAVPLLVELAREPARFLFNNLGYHALNATLFRLQASGEPVALGAKLRWVAGEILASPSGPLLLALCLGAAACVWARRRAGADRARNPAIHFAPVTLAAAFLAASAAALSPSPSWRQYLALPLPYAILLFCCLWRMAGPRAQGSLRALVWAAVILSLPGSGIAQGIRHRPPVADWPPIRIHAEAHRLADLLREGAASGRIATLRPLFAVEAGLGIYPELATGPFGYRMGDLLTAADRARFVLTSPETVAALLDRDPPAAVLVGFYPERLDGPLRRYAESRCYERVDPRLYRRTHAPCEAARAGR